MDPAGVKADPVHLTWRVLSLHVSDAADQLALTEAVMLAVADGLVPPTIRWYTYNTAAVVIGHGQPLEDIDVEECRRHGVGVYRRLAGGSAVLADPGLLGLAVALPLPHPLALPDLTESYRWLGAVLAGALSSLGVDARLISVEEARADAASAKSLGRRAGRLAACFGTFSPYEVAVGTRKIVGLAQARRQKAALYQCGILLRFDAGLLAHFLDGSNPEHQTARELRARTTDLATELGRVVDPSEVVGAVHRFLAHALGIKLEESTFSQHELATAARLRAEKYCPLETSVIRT